MVEAVPDTAPDGARAS